MSRILALVAALCLAAAVHAQAEFSEDLFPRLATLDKDVHFFGVDGDSTIVPAGTYLVTTSDDEIQLFNLQTAENFDIHAVAGTHEETVGEPTAMSVAGTEELPDLHEIVLIYADGSEISAVGSYSGIQPRGLLGDAKKKADAARRAAQQRAMKAKRDAQMVAAAARRRAEQLAAEARRRVEEGVAAARREARDEAGRLLAEIANAQAQGNNQEVARLSVLHGPRLAILKPASTSVQEKARIIAEARRRLQELRPFITEVLRRIAQSPDKFRATGGKLADAQPTEIARIIWGEGDNQLQHPFAGSAVSTRDAADDDISTRSVQGIAFTVGLSYDVAAIYGFGAGSEATWMIPGPSLFFPNCTYASAQVTSGADISAGASVDIGFWLRSPRGLDGPDFTVELGLAGVLGGAVSFSFDVTDDGFDFAGFAISPEAGAGFDFSTALGYSHLIGCINLALT